MDFPGCSDSKEATCNAGDLGSTPGLGRFSWRRERLPALVFWPREFHRLYSPRGRKESDTTERLALSLALFTVALQCCVIFCCTAKWIHLYVDPLCFGFPSPLAETWMDLETVTQIEVRKRNTSMWNLRKWCRWTYLQSRNRDTHVEKKNIRTPREEMGGGMNWEVGIDIHTLICIK